MFGNLFSFQPLFSLVHQNVGSTKTRVVHKEVSTHCPQMLTKVWNSCSNRVFVTSPTSKSNYEYCTRPFLSFTQSHNP